MQAIVCENCGHQHFVIPNRGEEKPSVDKIINVVTRYFKIPLETLKHKNRKRKNVYARQVLMYLLSEETRATLSHIGWMFNRDHTRVIYAKDKIKELASVYPEVENDLQELKIFIMNEN